MSAQILSGVTEIPIAEPLLTTHKSDVMRGLIDGTYTRWGGIIRKTKGQDGAGQIVYHLRDASERDASRVLKRVLNGMGQNHAEAMQQFGRVNQSLGKVLQLSQVGAAAGVLNLGVSVAGFAYMAYQMKQMRKSLAQVEGLVRNGFERVEGQLVDVVLRLEELKHFAMMNLAAAQDILDEVQTLRQEVFESEKARVLAALEMMLMDASEAGQQLVTFKEVRLAMEGILERAIDPGNPRRLVEIGTRFRLWALAVAAEAETLIMLGKLDEAEALYRRAGGFSLDQSTRWITATMPDNVWLSLGHTRFVGAVEDERLLRIGETALGVELTVSEFVHHKGRGALQHERSVRMMDDEEFNHRLGAAALVDMGVEVGRRLDTKADELELCQRQGWPLEEWRELGIEHGSLVLLATADDSPWK